eukprot:9369-Amphidinium_carterae.1
MMYDCGAAASIAPPSFAPHINLLPSNGDQKLQTVTDDEINVHGIMPNHPHFNHGGEVMLRDRQASSTRAQ